MANSMMLWQHVRYAFLAGFLFLENAYKQPEGGGGGKCIKFVLLQSLRLTGSPA